jgi:uncharacterized membrane protein (DUF4010 family)
MPVDTTEILLRLAVALAIGLLIGFERGWQSRALEEGRRTAGLRSFGLIGLAGGLAGVLYEEGDIFLLIGGLAAIVVFMAILYWNTLRERQQVGITTMIAVIVAYFLGTLAGLGELEVAGPAAVVVTLLLGIKPQLHWLLQRIEHRELMATIHLLVISVVLLPVLPNEGYGPWQAINPYLMWWMVVAVAGISYLGYFAIKIAGATRGVLMTGLAGGLVSSTAVTVNLARLASRRKRMEEILAAGVIVGAATMFPRILVVVGVFAPSMLPRLIWPLGLAAVVAYAAALLLARVGQRALRKDDGGGEVTPKNPFEIRVALQFGLLLAVIMLAARGMKEWLGDAGLFLLAAVSGLGDVDAITLSVASMVDGGEVASRVAGLAVVLAAAANTLVKPVLAGALGSLRMGVLVALPLALALAAASGGVFLPDLLGLTRPDAGG